METPETARGRWPLCQVCAGEFDWPRAHHSDEDRLFARCPRLLSCLHTVCEACLHDARERRGTYACHVCQARTNVESVHAISKLSVDWSAVDVCRRAAQRAGAYNCDECAEDEPAASWCETCGIGLCSFHRTNHARSRRTQEHAVVDLQRPQTGTDASDYGGYDSETPRPPGADAEPPQIAVSCALHPTEEVRFFCAHCCQLACRDCASTGPHVCRVLGRAATWTPVPAAAGALRDNAEKMDGNCVDMEGDVARALAKTDEASERVDEAARDAREAITNAFDAFRLTIAEREASLKKLVDDYANGVGLDLDSRRQALIADQRDVRVARAVGGAARDRLANRDAQYLSVTAAVARRLDDLRKRLYAGPLEPPAIDAAALRFEGDDASSERILELITRLGRVHRPDELDMEPAAPIKPPDAPSSTAPVELVVHALRPEGTVGASRSSCSCAPSGEETNRHRGRSRRRPRAAKKRQQAPNVDSFWRTSCPRGPRGPSSRAVVVTTTDPRLRGSMVESRRIESTGDPPTMRLLRTLAPNDAAPLRRSRRRGRRHSASASQRPPPSPAISIPAFVLRLQHLYRASSAASRQLLLLLPRD